MVRYYATIILTALLTVASPVLFSELVPKQFSLEGFFIAEDVTNFSGGAKNGSVFNGVYHPILNYHFLNNSHATSARIGILAITNSQPQFNYTYASQSVSNMTAQGEVILAELNYYQIINKWADMRFGLMDLREYLNVFDVPKELINSGFGTNRVMNNAADPATYPYPGFGVLVNFRQGKYGLGLSAFQANPRHQSTLFHDGAFFLEELTWNEKLALPQTPSLYLKLGSWQNYQPNPQLGFSNIGLYVMAQIVWINAAQKQINIMSQFGYGPNKANSLPYSFNLAMTISNLIPGRAEDKLGVGYSEIWLRNLTPEIVFEVTYAIQVMKNVSIKPDLQYIVHPSGIKPNAFAGILRLIYNIDGHMLARH